MGGVVGAGVAGGVAVVAAVSVSGGAVEVEWSWVHQRREREEAAEAALAVMQCCRMGWVATYSATVWCRW